MGELAEVLGMVYRRWEWCIGEELRGGYERTKGRALRYEWKSG